MSKQNRQHNFKRAQTVKHQTEIDAKMNSEKAEADWDQALEYKELALLKDEDGEFYPLGVSTSEFGKFGVGLQLFFDFVKLSAICMFIMALISIPALYSNIEGQGLQQNYSNSANSYGALTLANQPELVLISPSENATDAEIEEINTQNDTRINDFVNEMSDRRYWVVIPDIVYTCVFIIFIFLWRKRSKEIKKECMVAEAVPSHYTIYVWGFSHEISDEKLLKEHFQQFGHVQESRIVRDYYGTLFYHKKQAAIEHKIALEKRKNQIREKKGKSPKLKKLEKLNTQRQELQEKIQAITTEKFGDVVSHNQYPSVGAYIVFNSLQDRRSCIDAYEKSHAFCGDKDERCFFQGKLIQVRNKVDEPSNIKWENLDCKTAERCARMTCVFFAVLCVMLLTFTVIFVANIVKPTNDTQCPSTDYTFQEAQAANDKDTTTCFCKQQDYSTLQNDLDIKEFCWDTYIEYVSLAILTVATAFTVMIVNFLLKLLLRALGRFSKYPTITKETLGITISLFSAMFVNTALITLLLQADIFGFTPAIVVSSPIPPLSTLQDEKATQFSADFDRPWYIEVAAKITITMFANIFSPHLAFWCLIPYYRRKRTNKAKKQLVQKDMNTFMTGAQFNVTGYYAAVLNTIFVTLFYSSGVPILLWFGALSLTVQYWVYKYYVLRYNKKPPALDNKLNKRVISILPLAAIIHLLIGIYMYGSPLIFPGDSGQISTSVSNDVAQAEGNSNFDSISVRITNSPIMFAFLVIIVAVQILDKTLIVILKKFYKCLFCVKKKDKLSSVIPLGKNKEQKHIFGTYQEEYEGMSKRVLSSYDIRLNEEYASLISAIEATKKDHETKKSQEGSQGGDIEKNGEKDDQVIAINSNDQSKEGPTNDTKREDEKAKLKE